MRTDPNIPDPDLFYTALVTRQEGLDAEQTTEYLARLVFLLANQIGDQQLLMNCIEAAAKAPAPQ